MLLPSFPIAMMFIFVHLYTIVLVYLCLLFGLMMFSYCLFISMFTMLRSIYLLNDEANLPLYLKGKSGWSLPNDSFEKVRTSYG